jgi:hypothetical protein
LPSIASVPILVSIHPIPALARSCTHVRLVRNVSHQGWDQTKVDESEARSSWSKAEVLVARRSHSCCIVLDSRIREDGWNRRGGFGVPLNFSKAGSARNSANSQSVIVNLPMKSNCLLVLAIVRDGPLRSLWDALVVGFLDGDAMNSVDGSRSLHNQITALVIGRGELALLIQRCQRCLPGTQCETAFPEDPVALREKKHVTKQLKLYLYANGGLKV